MMDGPLASNNENYVHYWLQDTVEVHDLLLDEIVCFALSTSEEHMRLFA
jgi:hypothetical protein